MLLRRPSAILALAVTAATAGPTWSQEEADPFEGIEFRLVGPSRGGRVTAVAGHVSHPHTFYMGSTGGGVWRTTNAGISWENLSDDYFRAGSVGAVTVAPSDPNVIYVGMGSAQPRGNVSIGDGVYRSIDAGGSWRHIGLPRAGAISKVEVHPNDPNVLWVGVLGQIFGSNPERGVYRSTDGGDTWEQVLYVSDDAGIADLELDPFNPRVLYAAAWRVERKPWTLIDGSDEGGLFRSTDGGDTWEQLEGGLPTGVLGRIGVSASPARRGRLWTIITAAEGRGGIFRSEDHGDTWKKVSDEPELLTRGWYYSHIDADAADPNTVWGSNVRFFRSVDAGATWERVGTPHADNHDLWINPEHPHIMVQGNDGGANVSVDGGRSWSTQNNQPTAEFYRVTV
ncbi:MAG: glycosyl hydrolase, partial [Acidobacteriota bacterium]|nr:glycosyl hydrolase [Acidobacteriota bacterium]